MICKETGLPISIHHHRPFQIYGDYWAIIRNKSEWLQADGKTWGNDINTYNAQTEEAAIIKAKSL